MRSKRNVVQSQMVAEKLKLSPNAYHNRAISKVPLEELIALAKYTQPPSGGRTWG